MLPLNRGGKVHRHESAVHVTAGQVNECMQFEEVMNRVRIGRRTRPEAVAGDKGYCFTAIRDWLRDHSIKAVIPWRKGQHPEDGRQRFNRGLYRRRSVVEQCVDWLKECRRLSTRFEKLAVNFIAVIQVASIERYLRVAFSDRA